ncbi:nuclease domain-containing protein [Clostridium sp. CM028]
MKQLSLLYEYWCSIKINPLLRKRYKLISTDFIAVNRKSGNIKIITFTRV